MKIKILTQQQLEGIVYTYFNEHHNCVIKLHEESSNDFFYFTSSKLNNTSILLSMSAGDVSVGDVVSSNDGKSIMNWIKDKCNYIDFGVANLTLYLEDNKDSDKLNFRQSYIKNHIDIKKTTPILITEIDDALDLFKRYLINDNCTKLIFSFSVLIPDLNHQFKLDLVIDKMYVYNKTFICFSTVRPDIKGYFPGYDDCIFRYIPNNEHSLMQLDDECDIRLFTLFSRCAYVSKEEIDIYAYSNCEVI
jgi:hypothetical protein